MSKSSYKGPLFEALPGELVISKIRVGQGSFGLVPDNLNHLAVSPEYPVYDPNLKSINRSFLALTVRSPEFLRKLTVSGNTTKQRIKPAAFEDLAIPLPSLDEQRALVAAYAAAQETAAAAETGAAAVESAGARAFAEALGLATPPPLPDRPAFIARFASLDRWGHEAALRRATGADEAAAKWPIVRLGDVIADLENGWSPQCLDRPAEPGEWGVLKVSAASSGRFRADQNKALPPTLSPRPSLEITTGQAIITRASGVASLVGIPAYVNDAPSKLMLCDKLFRVVTRGDAALDLQFLVEVLSQPLVRQQVFGEFSTASGMMKNISKPALLALTFPLPPLDVQRTLVAHLTAARTRAAALREEAQALRTAARAEFEAAIWA